MTTYTQAGFTVSSLYIDSYTAQPTKSIVVPNIRWGQDYSVVDASEKEATLMQFTSADMTQYERVRIGRSEVADIYANTQSAASARLPDTRGVQVMVELREVYRAVSTATGVAYDLPCIARTVVRIPYNAAVSPDLVADVTLRVAGMLGTLKADGLPSAAEATKTVTDAVRGDLTPYRVYEQ